MIQPKITKLATLNIQPLLPLLLLFILLASLQPLNAYGKANGVKKNPKILLAVPNTNGFPFWLRVRNFATVVSKSLNIDQQIISFSEPSHDRSFYSDKLEQVIEKQGKPDFIISMLWQNGQTNIFNLADQYQIPLITINSNFKLEDQNKYIPRVHHKYWYGHISPNDFDAGFLLAEHLIKNYGNKPGNLIALTGDNYGAPSINRVAGLKQSLSNHPNIKLTKLIYTDWSSISGKNQLLANYDQQPINLIWTASDFIAQGVIKAIEQKQGSLNQIKIGSVDWNEQGIGLIKSHKLEVSFGGHFIEAGIALILALDVLNGHDFKDELGTLIKTDMNALHYDNINSIGSALNYAHWRNLNFKHLSKTYNKRLKRYQLNFESLLQYK